MTEVLQNPIDALEAQKLAAQQAADNANLAGIAQATAAAEATPAQYSAKHELDLLEPSAESLRVAEINQDAAGSSAKHVAPQEYTGKRQAPDEGSEDIAGKHQAGIDKTVGRHSAENDQLVPTLSIAEMKARQDAEIANGVSAGAHAVDGPLAPMAEVAATDEQARPSRIKRVGKRIAGLFKRNPKNDIAEAPAANEVLADTPDVDTKLDDLLAPANADLLANAPDEVISDEEKAKMSLEDSKDTSTEPALTGKQKIEVALAKVKAREDAEAALAQTEVDAHAINDQLTQEAQAAAAAQAQAEAQAVAEADEHLPKAA